MSKFSKRYNDTFNNIHAPDSIKKEVLTMAKKSNQQRRYGKPQDSTVITTPVEEVSKSSNVLRTLATSLALIGVCCVSLVFINHFNDDIPNANIDDTLDTEPTTLTTEVTTTEADGNAVNVTSEMNTTVNTTTLESVTQTDTSPKDTTTHTSNTTTTSSTVTTTNSNTQNSNFATTSPVQTDTTTPTTTPTTTETIQTYVDSVGVTITCDVYHLVVFPDRPETLPSFLSSDLQQSFADAYSIQQNIDFRTSPFLEYSESEEDTVRIGDHENYTSYCKVTNSQIRTLDDVETYLRQYFTDDYIDNYHLMDYFIEQDNYVYVYYMPRGGNVYYMGHTFYLDSQSDEKVTFHADAYYQVDDGAADMFNGGYVYNQEPSTDYTVERKDFVLVKTENGWRIDGLETMV